MPENNASPTLASSRITLQQEWNGAVFTIGPARDWTLLFLALWLAFWVTVPLSMATATFRSLSQHQSISFFNLVWTIGWAFGVCFVLSRLAWALGGREILRLSPAELSLTWRLFGFTLRTRTAPTSEIRNLRFVPKHRAGRNYTPSRIAFEDQRGTVKFASGLEDAEAFNLINTMLAIYPFPRQDPALAYMRR